MKRRDALLAIGSIATGCGDDMTSRFRNTRHQHGPGGRRPTPALPLSIAQIGTSHTNNADSAGWRKVLADYKVANSLAVTFVGTRTSGPGAPFPPNDAHDGQPAAQLANRVTHVTANYGPGKQFSAGRLIITEAWTNDLRQVEYDINTYLPSVSSYLTLLTTLWPHAQKVIILNQSAIDAGIDAMAAGRVSDFNVGLDNIVDTLNAPLSSPRYILIDAYTALGANPGASFIAGDAYHLEETGYGIVSPLVLSEAEPILLAT